MASDNKITIELDLETKKIKNDPFKQIEKGAQNAQVVVNNFGRSVERSQRSLIGSFEKVAFNLTDITNILLRANAKKGGGLFARLTRLSAVSGSLGLLATALDQVDSRFAKTAASAARFSAILITGFVGAVTLAIAKLSELGLSASNNLIDRFQGIANKSNQLQREIQILNGFIDNYNATTAGAIGTSSSWAREIESLSGSFNIQRKELNKSAREIISVASQYGLAEDQLKSLLKISAEYAKVNGKDVFQTSVNLVGALAGNAQAVQSLGIKLNEAAVSSFALKKGLTDNFKGLTENSKVQVRYQKLLTQYSKITGIAAASASSLADQEEALAVTTEKLGASFGRGVAKLENLNLVTAAYNKVAGLLSTGTVEAAGFISALGTRFVQAASFLAGLSLKIFVVVKAFSLFNSIINTNIKSTTILSKKIPLINRSFASLSSTITGGRLNLKNLAASLTAFRISLLSTIPALGAFSASTSKATFLTAAFSKGIKSLGIAIKTTFIKAIPLIAPILVVLAKVAAVIGAVVGVVILLRNAFRELEKRTRVFSEIYQIVLKELKASASVFQPIIDLLVDFRNKIVDIAQRAFGLLIAAIAKVVSIISALVARNPFGVFSDETVKAFASIENRLDSFTAKLSSNGFKLQAFGENASRNVASAKDKIVKDLDFVQKKFDQTGKKVDQVSSRIGNVFANGLVNIIRFGAESIGAALQKGIFSFENFGSAVIGLIGDIAIQLGTTLIAAGKGIEALRNSVVTLFGGQAIAAGIALVALGGFLKSFSSAQTGGSSGGGGGGVGTNAFPPPENDLSRPNDDLTEQRDRRENEEPQTAVNINIQGDILDSEETGTRIAKVLSDSFGKQGIVLTDARFA